MAAGERLDMDNVADPDRRDRLAESELPGLLATVYADIASEETLRLEVVGTVLPTDRLARCDIVLRMPMLYSFC